MKKIIIPMSVVAIFVTGLFMNLSISEKKIVNNAKLSVLQTEANAKCEANEMSPYNNIGYCPPYGLHCAYVPEQELWNCDPGLST